MHQEETQEEKMMCEAVIGLVKPKFKGDEQRMGKGVDRGSVDVKIVVTGMILKLRSPERCANHMSPASPLNLVQHLEG